MTDPQESQAKVPGRAARLWQRLKELPFNEIVDITAKLAAPVAVILAAVLAQSFQSSMSTNEMLTAREQSDTQIRAEMFKAITEKLMGAKDIDPDPTRKAVFAELLALNFHEHFELKPLMTEVDDALRAQLAKVEDEAQLTRIENRRYELHSVVRRVRARQTAMLVKRPYVYVPGFVDWMPSYFVERKVAEENFKRGEIKMLSVRFTGPPWSEENPAPSACDVSKEDPGQHACVDEPMLENAPDGQDAISIIVKQPKSWERETFTFHVQHMMHQKKMTKKELDLLYTKSTGTVSECGRKLTPSVPGAIATSAAGGVEFDVTQFDLPMTDNTPLPSGSRYAIYIERICPYGDGGGEKVVKFALMWFPKDYFPPRERPTNYQELRQKLNVQIDK